jgi:hypothetical protein
VRLTVGSRGVESGIVFGRWVFQPPTSICG